MTDKFNLKLMLLREHIRLLQSPEGEDYALSMGRERFEMLDKAQDVLALLEGPESLTWADLCDWVEPEPELDRPLRLDAERMEVEERRNR